MTAEELAIRQLQEVKDKFGDAVAKQWLSVMSEIWITYLMIGSVEDSQQFHTMLTRHTQQILNLHD